MTIIELVEAAQRGDRAAFPALVERFQDMAVGYALGRLRGDLGAAQDAAQEALLEAFEKLPQLREPAAFGGWLKRIVHKRCDRHTRRRAVEPAPLEPPPGADEALDLARARARVRAAVEALPEPERIVVALHYLGEVPQRDVADFLELPLSTVKKRLFTARRRLERERRHEMQIRRPSETNQFQDRVGLFLAIRSDDLDAVEAILDRHPDWLDAPERWTDAEALEGEHPLAHPRTPLILAAARGDLALVRRLLARGADVDGRCGCDGGDTPLFAAVLNGRPAVTRALLEAGADPDVENAVGHTPLHVAELRGRRDLAEVLRTAGADPGRRARNGKTADDYRAARPEPEPSSSAGLCTGIKALDLLAPLAPGMRVRVHGAAETGLMVLLAELSHRLLARGFSVMWSTRAAHPWQRRELADTLAEAGLEERVEVRSDGVPAGADRFDGRWAHVCFRTLGHEAELEARLPDLAGPDGLAFVVDPWIRVTRGEAPAPTLAPPFDALVVTDPGMAAEGLYPAIDVTRTASNRAVSEAQAELQEKVRARAADPRLRAFFSQPFFVAAAHNGMAGVDVELERTLTDFTRLVHGEIEAPPERLVYLGGLPPEV